MLFRKQEPREKRRLLNFLLSNCSWKGGKIISDFRQPFDMLADANTAEREWHGQDVSPKPIFEKWLALEKDFRAFGISQIVQKSAVPIDSGPNGGILID
jgi:hypothetical protein